MTFIDTFLTEEFCEHWDVYGYDARTRRHVVVDRDWREVKHLLLADLGQPIVDVVDANYANRGRCTCTTPSRASSSTWPRPGTPW